METKKHYPQPRQTLFLRNAAYEAMYGGAKGGGKSWALIADATRQLNNPRYKAIIFRRTYPKLTELIDRSHFLFSSVAEWSGELKRWTFPSGATIQFAHLQHERDKYNYQGQEYHYIGFDQLEEFTESQYLFIIGQNRTATSEIKCYIRATANPGNVGHYWVKSRFVDKLDKDGKIKYFCRVNDEDVECSKDDEGAMSRAYVFATVYDNAILTENDPLYVSRLMALPLQLKKALLFGDWEAFEGQFFGEWDKSRHVITINDFNRLCSQDNVRRFLAMDYGFAAPASVGWYAAFPCGRLVRYKELYVSKQTYETLGQSILDLCDRGDQYDFATCDPAIAGDKSHHHEPKDGEARGESGLDVMRKTIGGRMSVLTADNRRIVGWTRFHEYLMTDIDGAPMFQVTDNCKNFIRTIPGIVHDETNPEDCDSAGEDHAVDEARYAIMTRCSLPNPKEKPKPAGEAFWDRVNKDLKKDSEDGERNLSDD